MGGREDEVDWKREAAAAEEGDEERTPRAHARQANSELRSRELMS